LMPGCLPIEYPKWIGGVLVQNAAEERDHRAALGEITSAHPTKLAHPASSAAERMRRARKRRRVGLRVIPFEIRDNEVSGLIARGLLEDVARNDPNEIARALGELFDAVPPEQCPAGKKQ